MKSGSTYPATWKFDHAEAARLYLAGLSTTQTAAALGVSAPTVLRVLRQQGVAIRSISDAKVLRHAGSRSKQTGGYIFVRVGKGRRKLEHILIAEAALGRELRDGEHVHHINCDPADNRRENLLICSRSYHIALHRTMERVGFPCIKRGHTSHD